MKYLQISSASDFVTEMKGEVNVEFGNLSKIKSVNIFTFSNLLATQPSLTI